MRRQRGARRSKGQAGEKAGTAVAVSAQTETAVVEGRVTANGSSLLWSVMSAPLLKIAQERTTGGSYRGENRHAG